MKARNTDIRLADTDLRLLEQETITRAEEVLGGIPAWYWENKERIENNRKENEEMTQHFLLQLKRIMAMCRGIR